MATFLEPSGENPLEFDDIILAFHSVFPFPIIKNTTKEQSIKILKEKGVNAVCKGPCMRDFETAEKFLIPEKITHQYYRLELDGFKVSFLRTLKRGAINVTLTARVFLTVYPNIGIGALLTNIRLSECDVDDIIFLQQSMYDKTKLSSTLSASLGKTRKRGTYLIEVVQDYVHLILSAFGIPRQDVKISTFRCIEIRGLSGTRVDDPEELFEKFSRQIYGLLTVDEGWRYVPAEVAKARMRSRWRTRSFLSVVAFADCVILVNLREKEPSKYTESQEQVREKYGCKVDGYFVFCPEIAGLNHGPLLMLENASIQFSIMEQISEKSIDIRVRSIKELLNTREKLTDALVKLSLIKIPEMGVLEQNVQEAMHVKEKTRELKETLEELERALLIRYNQRINLVLMMLTVVSLCAGILQILIATGLLNSLSRALELWRNPFGMFLVLFYR